MVRRRRLPTLLVLLSLATAACGGPGQVGSPPPSGTPASDPAMSAPPGSPPAATAPGGSGAPAPATPTPPPAGTPSSGTWARIAIDGLAPNGREDHTWTLDEDGRVAYLFGGRGGGTTFGDLWAFDLAAGSWARLEPQGDAPAPRFGHEAAWIPGQGLAVTFGQAGSSFFDDLWLYDPVRGAWRELPAGGAAPVARYGSCSGMGPDGRLWVSHGFTEDGVRFADTRAYDFAAGSWTDVTPPAGDAPVKRCLHACWWTTGGRLALYAGQTNGAAALGDLWRLDPASAAWSELRDPGPSARQLAAVGRAGSLTVVFGGRDIERRALRDTWLLSDAAIDQVAGPSGFVELATPGERPSARSGAALVQDASAGRLLMFGGIGDGPLDDLWSLTFD